MCCQSAPFGGCQSQLITATVGNETKAWQAPPVLGKGEPAHSELSNEFKWKPLRKCTAQYDTGWLYNPSIIDTDNLIWARFCHPSATYERLSLTLH